MLFAIANSWQYNFFQVKNRRLINKSTEIENNSLLKSFSNIYAV